MHGYSCASHSCLAWKTRLLQLNAPSSRARTQINAVALSIPDTAAAKASRTEAASKVKGLLAAAKGEIRLTDDVRDAFQFTIKQWAVRVPIKLIAGFNARFKRYRLLVNLTLPVVEDPDSTDVKRCITYFSVDDELPVDLARFVAQSGLEVVEHTILVDYAKLTTDDVLEMIIPDELQRPRGFEQTGHIIHLNLRDELMPYRYIVGQTLLDKLGTRKLRTVVCKVGVIENAYRTFPMEVVAGEDDMEVELRNNNCWFKLDYAKVYYNSRLHSEHTRYVEQVRASAVGGDTVVLDCMAGAGPFAVPLAKKGVTVYGNDLNPTAVRYLRANAQRNKASRHLHSFCLDARTFITMLAGGQAALDAEGITLPPNLPPASPAAATPDAGPQPAQSGQLAAELSSKGDAANSKAAKGTGDETQQGVEGVAAAPDRGEEVVARFPEGWSVPPTGVVFHHAVMNLPASAVMFLDAFRACRFNPGLKGRRPLISVYLFTQGEDPQVAREIVEKYLGDRLDGSAVVQQVRLIAPYKSMFLACFKLPESYFREPEKQETADGEVPVEAQPKRVKF